MRSSTPHLMLAICTIAVQAAPISPAPKTPDMITVMARGELEAGDPFDTNNLHLNLNKRGSVTEHTHKIAARDTFDNNNLHLNLNKRGSVTEHTHKIAARDTFDNNNLHVNFDRRGSVTEHRNKNQARPNVRRSIGGYTFPSDSIAVGKRDEAQSNPPAAPASGLMSDSDADSGFNSDSASDSGSGFNSDSDSDDDNLGPRDEERNTHLEVRDAPENPTFPAGEDSLDDMFEADADDEFDENDLDSQDVETQHAEIKRSAEEFSEDPEALDRRDERSEAAQENDEGAQTFDSDSDFDSASDSEA